MDIAAYIPCYKGGNAVMEVYEDGRTEIINKSIKSLIAGLFRKNSMDIRYVRQDLSKATGEKCNVPLPLS